MHLIVKDQVECTRAKSPAFILPLDVRAKHGRCLVCQLARCFAPRQFNRSAALAQSPGEEREAPAKPECW